MKTTSIVIRRRITGLFLLAAAFLSCIILRLAWVQIVKGDEYRQKGIINRMRDVPVEAKRGSILDRNGNELVTSVSADSVYAIPNHIKNPDEVAVQIAPLLGMDVNKVKTIITRKSRFEWLKRKVDYETSQKIKALKIEGIGFAEESKRYYKQETLAPHILGFTGTDNQGLMGMEAAFDEELKGIPGRIVIEHDAAGREIPQALHQYIPPSQGNNLVLTLDQTIQHFVERELDKIVVAHRPKTAVIIVMDPQTGEVLAMGNRPTFNPNKWREAPQQVWDRNPAIWYNYEPGSTFKIVTAAAALEENAVKPSDRFYCPGYIQVADRKIRCWKDGGHGSQSFEEVVQNSCNPGFIQTGLNLGKEKFYKYIRAFGFGQPTGIGLPGEAKGIIIRENDATNLNIATMSIGQSIAVTPIQLLSAVCAVANGGKLMKPQLVKRVEDQKGNVIKEYKPEMIRQVISAETARLTGQLLENVVFKGTGKNAFVEGYRAAGKTGTAQVVAERGGYASGKYVASFVGFAPVNDPKIAVLIMIAEPQGGAYYGGVVAAPVFSPLALDILRYLGVPEQKNLPKPKTNPWEVEQERIEVAVPNVVNLPLDEAQKTLREAGLAFETRGQGRVVYGQIPESGALVLSGTTVILDLAGTADAKNKQGEQVSIPDLKGMTIREAGNLLESIGLKLEPVGSGLAVTQSPAPGQKLPRGSTVKVEFKPPSAANKF
ncbi:stage V sporulation protein D [Desulforamulus hydrothermalis]|uniref:Stage V sporulation protein D n=1 Tax=Desulforamulus hydrothermalis Lam5 = DSM 18033 TaxID=1121428 RepID=K8DZW6_9FIRM|nr:stage V sporulation protein D [Desulforamulus hydrothermalis]CCO08719.1 Stage V sporulation protein D [Desulforamulus hydrothermalis Lam5 = DSM 18033]SHG69930.1 stage V sporulation protein D (sporulation-specific penicillin-binding protein) [Desulforamulus hydrothermalis Lam5 = DSM 18033]